MVEFDPIDDLRQEILSLIRPGDSLLDLTVRQASGMSGAVPAGIKVVCATGDSFELLEAPCPKKTVEEKTACHSFSDWTHHDDRVDGLVDVLKANRVTRLLVLTDSAAETENLSIALKSHGIEVLQLAVPEATRAEDFMSADDADAVVARLRELGYI